MNRKKYKFRQSYRNHHRQHLEHKAIPASTCIILIRLQEGPLLGCVKSLVSRYTEGYSFLSI